MSVYSVDRLMDEARRLAAEYRRATGKPLPVSGEIARHDAARLLDLELVDGAELGYDALGRGTRAGLRYQIKGRAVFSGQRSQQRLGELRMGRQWDSVLLVLMDDEFQPYEIHEARRDALVAALGETDGSKRRNRGTLSVARFKAIGRRVWNRYETADGGGSASTTGTDPA